MPSAILTSPPGMLVQGKAKAERHVCSTIITSKNTRVNVYALKLKDSHTRQVT